MLIVLGGGYVTAVFQDITAPTITFLAPEAGSISWNSEVIIGAEYHDNNAVDPESLIMKIDGNPILTGMGKTTRLVAYRANLGLGTHIVDLSIRDKSGNIKNATLSFIVLPWTYLATFAAVLLVVSGFLYTRRRARGERVRQR
jgi:hypothetical protein